MDGLGGGLVTPVTRDVKLPTSPKTLPEKVCTPLTTEAAKSEPGKWGMETGPDDGLDGEDVLTLGAE